MSGSDRLLPKRFRTHIDVEKAVDFCVEKVSKISLFLDAMERARRVTRETRSTSVHTPFPQHVMVCYHRDRAHLARYRQVSTSAIHMPDNDLWKTSLLHFSNGLSTLPSPRSTARSRDDKTSRSHRHASRQLCPTAGTSRGRATHCAARGVAMEQRWRRDLGWILVRPIRRLFRPMHVARRNDAMVPSRG